MIESLVTRTEIRPFQPVASLSGDRVPMTRMSLSRSFAVGTVFALAATAVSAQAAWITFSDQTSTRLPTATDFTSDPDEKDFSLVDIDHDGDLDLFDVQKNSIYSSVSARTHRLLLNTGGVFTEASATHAPDFANNPSIGRLGVIRDFDGDGWEDMVVVNTNNAGCTTGNQLQFYRNLGDGGGGPWLGLVYDTAGRFPQYSSPCARFCSGDAGDVDNDGDQDLYVGDYNNTLEDRLLINDGTGVFTDETTTRIPGGTSSTFSVEIILVDINNDGYIDLCESDGTVGLVKIRPNDGTGNFPNLVQPPNAQTYTLAAGDLNNDGLIDLYQGRDAQDAYNLNTTATAGASPTFTTTVLNNSPGTQGFAGNAYIVDMDNDGLRDLVMGDIDVDVPNCGRHATVLRNIFPTTPILMDPYGATGGCSPGSGGCQNFHTNGTHDIAVLDLNGDGRNDMVMALCTGYKCFIQNLPPLALAISEPAPGAMHIAVSNAPPNAVVYNLGCVVQLTVTGSGPFFGLDASAFSFFTLFYPQAPFVGVADALGNYTFDFPAGTFNQSVSWPFQMRSVTIVGPGQISLSNIATQTF
jgi:hypothetical protein